MPPTVVFFYQEDEDHIPVLDWLEELRDQRAVVRLNVAIDRLRDEGYALGRPTAAPLRDQISELRTQSNNVNYRLLYFFHNQSAILAHGLTKEGAVPDSDIKIAIKRHKSYIQDPVRHTYQPEPDEEA